MNKGDLIKRVKELYTLNFDACNKILGTISNEYKQKAVASGKFHQTIKDSPLYWETEIEWFSKQTIAPLQLRGFEYTGDGSTLRALADNHLSGPPATHRMCIQDVPASILLAAILILYMHKIGFPVRLYMVISKTHNIGYNYYVPESDELGNMILSTFKFKE